MPQSLMEGRRPAIVARTLFAVASLAALFSRFFHHGLLLGFYQDDFFYYLKVAQNLALHGISSFDGIHLTNGYHPLWLLTLALLRLCLRGQAFFVALQALTLVSAFACYAGTERVLRTLQIREPLRSIGTFIVSMQALLLLRYGMEVTLALPFGIGLAALLLDLPAAPSPRHLFWLGVLGSLTILGRLDAILLVTTLFLLVLWRNRSVHSPRKLLPLLLGFFPLAVYLAVNEYFFHLLTPVSGHAKQLKATLLPSISTLHSLLFPMDRMKIIFVLPCLLLLAAGIVAAIRTLPLLPKIHSAVLLALLLFPILQLSLLSVISDWALWPWYFYSLVFSSIASVVLLARIPHRSPEPARTALTLLGATLAGAYVIYIAAYSVLMPNSIAIYISSSQLAQFMDTHPGTYAMGDQAGMTGYLSSQPVIQLEGLVMDAEYLRKIQQQEPLHQILDDYGANFYITLAANPPGSCSQLREPSQAGPHSPVSRGTVCAPPLATFHRNNIPIYIFDAHTIR